MERKLKSKHLPQILIIGLLWLILAALCWAKPEREFSDSERRKLAQLPELTGRTLLSGAFMEDFEEYTLDQFPARDNFRTLKAASVFCLYRQMDNNGIYIAGGHAASLEYPLNEASVISAAGKFGALYDRYMQGADVNVYLSVVPDKGYFLAEENGYPAMNYDRLIELMRENMPFAGYIDITGYLALGDYYTTDPHCRQEEIIDAAQKLAGAMGAAESFSGNYTRLTAGVPFYGVYYGQSALPLKSDTIRYLTNETLDACTVNNIETGDTTWLYDMDKLHGRDPYEMFLSGAAAVLYIESPKAQTDRELVVFRDSFAGSLIPLLAECYTKITLVDTRYIATELVGDYVGFSNQDVLFIYSTTILNASTVLK